MDGPVGILLLGAGDETAAELSVAAGRPVVASEGPVVATPGGTLFAASGWWRHTPGGRRVAAGSRWPAPAWQPLVPDHMPWPVSAHPIPAGWRLSTAGSNHAVAPHQAVDTHQADDRNTAGDRGTADSNGTAGGTEMAGGGDTAGGGAGPGGGDTAGGGAGPGGLDFDGEGGGASDLALSVAVDPDRLRLLVDPSVTGAELAATVRALPPAVRPLVDVVPLAPGQGAGRAVASAAARDLAEPVHLINGVPLHTPSGDIAVYALDAALRPVWPEPAWRLRYLPSGQEEVLSSSPPQPSLRPIDPATYAMDLGWLVRLSGGGLHAEPSGPLRPARGRAEVPARRPTAAPPAVIELIVDLASRPRRDPAATPHGLALPAGAPPDTALPQNSGPGPAGPDTPRPDAAGPGSPGPGSPAAEDGPAVVALPQAALPQDDLRQDAPASAVLPDAAAETAIAQDAHGEALAGAAVLGARSSGPGPVAIDGRYRVVVGTPGLDINELLWPPLSALFTAALTDIPAPVDLAVAGNATPWGLAAAKELAERHAGAGPRPAVPRDAEAAGAGGGAGKPFRRAETLPLTEVAATDAVSAGTVTGSRRRLLLVAAAIVALVLLGVGVAAAWPRGPRAGDDRAAAEPQWAEPGLAPGAGGGSSVTSAGPRASRSAASASAAPSASRSSGSPAPATAGSSAAPGGPSAGPSQTQANVADGVNLAAGRDTRDSGHTDVYGSGNITDGDPMSYWESRNNGFPQWVQVDLGAPAELRRAVLRLPPSDAWPARSERIEVQASMDDKQFTSLVGPASYTFAQSSGQRVTIALPGGQWRYVRLVFTANTVQPAGQLSQLELYRA
ncbi:discoidin domain-containing protein [Dactylosporangium sp. NPDC000555]|uniref:discoidin domain-containing protein n=1 Tax=Dactylosporangium sp. NPDC000555 TaxID=3154260 RepID=UPI00331D946F